MQRSVHKLTDKLVLLAGVFAPIVIMLSSLRYFEFGLHPTFVFEILNGLFLVSLCLCKKKLSFHFKAYSLVFAGLFTTCYSIIFYGFVDLGIIYSIVVIVFVATVFSVRKAIITAVFVLIIVSVLAILHVTDVLEFVALDSAEYAGSFIAWLLAIGNITLSGMIVLSIIVMYKRLTSYYTLKLIRHSKRLSSQAEELKNAARSDYLTGLRNRTAFIDDFQEEIETLPNDLSLAMMCIDINNFAQINERFGYQIGDQIIIRYAERLEALIKNENLPIKNIYRVEGDEFVLLTTPLSSIENKLNDLYEMVKTTTLHAINTSHSDIQISVKACAATYPQHASSVDELIISARLALNHSRKKGSQFCTYEKFMFENMNRRLGIEKKIQKAIIENQFSIAFQKVYNIKSKNVVGKEALIRWHDSELGDIQPSDFISIAEQSGQIKEIDFWVIEKVFRQISKEDGSYREGFYFAINVSVSSLSSKAFIDKVQALQQEYQINPEQVVFEITEYVIINRYDDISKTLTGLKEQGYKISLDDFGTGYSSLSYLANLSVDYLKLDRSFIQSITQAKNKSLMLGIISMVDILGISMIVEGVETTQQLAWLEEIDYDFSLQGFYFHKPELIAQS
jgi:diguanylate cyclase (GGDEF)-like protein